jgi:hypothetical protein
MEDVYEFGPLNELAAALAKAQFVMANPKFDKLNPHFKNKFASLASVRDAVIPVLAEHGITCLQDLTNVEGGVACTTILIHSSGQSMRFGPLKMPVSKADAQGFGSAATYARRYHLMAVANVVGDEDDDANEATGKPAQAQQLKPGIGYHSPMGETEVTVSAQLYATNFKAAFANDDVTKAGELHRDLHAEGEEAYRNAWALLDSKTRTWAKKAIEATKDKAA